MIGNWKKEICAVRPEELQVIADEIYMERKNIHEVEHEAIDGQDSYTQWECDSREIGFSDYNLIKTIEEFDTDKAIDEYTMQLIEEGVL